MVSSVDFDIGDEDMHLNAKYNSPEWEQWQSEIVNPEEKNIGGKILKGGLSMKLTNKEIKTIGLSSFRRCKQKKM